MGARLPIALDVLAALCRRRRIRKLSLFGSQLKGTARPDSDIDLLVEFEPDSGTVWLHMRGACASTFDWSITDGVAEIEIELSEHLGGKKVDLRTPAELSRYFREEVVRTAEPQYVAS